MECTIFLTDSCNFHCTYCYEEERKNPNMIHEETLKKAIDYVVENNDEDEPLYITFLGGEPLLNKKMLWKAMELFERDYKEQKKAANFRITTNGLYLDEETIDFLEDNGFIISISIDGDKETHNLNRISNDGKDVYDDIINNMKLMMDKKVDFMTRMTITGNNVSKALHNIKYFFDMGVKFIHFGIDTKHIWSEEERKELDRQLDFIDDYYLSNVIEENKILDFYDYKITTFIAYREPCFCSAGTRGHCVINSKGEIFPCNYVSNDAEWVIGNVDTGLDSKKFIEVVKKHVIKSDKCKDCEIAFSCSGKKCGFLNYVQTGCLTTPADELCVEQKLLYKHQHKVIRELYRRKHPRIMKYLELAKVHNIPLSNVMKNIINEVDGGTRDV